MDFLEIFLRSGTIILLFLLAILDCRDCRVLTRRIIMSGLCLCVAAYLLGKSPATMQISDNLRFVAYFLGAPSMIFIWLFGLLVFEDDFRIQRRHIILGILYVIPAFIMCGIEGYKSPNPPSIWMIGLNIYGIILMAHLGYKILSGYQNDLVVKRRRIRFLFIGALLSVGTMTSLAHMQALPFSAATISWFETIAIFVMTVWAFLWLTRMDENQLMFRPATPPSLVMPALQNPQDEVLKSRLMSLMEEEKAYLEHGLTIRKLAETLKAPEHRLRRVINAGLGYRNFSAFLNDYRICAIKLALADVDNANLPILTLAMDHGYSSLAPFNRAFRAAEGMTPSEYRTSLLT